MNHSPFPTACSLILLLALLLIAGCAAAPSRTNAARSVTYQPVRSAVQFDAPASLQVEYVLAPEMRTVWLKSLDDEAALENYRQTVRNLIVNDLTQSGIFTRVTAVARARRFSPSDQGRGTAHHRLPAAHHHHRR